MTVTDEELVAYVDGELEAVEATRVALAVAADLELMRRVQHQRELRQQLGAAFAPIIEQEVPVRLSVLLTPPCTGRAPRPDPLPAKRHPVVIQRSPDTVLPARRHRLRGWWIAAPLAAAGAALVALLTLAA